MVTVNDPNASEEKKQTMVQGNNRWMAYTIETYRDRRTPLLSSVSGSRIEQLAREKMEEMDKLGELFDL